MCLSLRFCVISLSEKAVKQMREERKQMLQKIIDNDKHWEKAKEEVTQVVAQHSVTQTKLEEQEQLTFKEEQRARVSDNIQYVHVLRILHGSQCVRKKSFPQCYSVFILCSTERDGKAEERSDRSDYCPGSTKGKFMKHFRVFI